MDVEEVYAHLECFIKKTVYFQKFRHFRHIYVLFRHIRPCCGIIRTQDIFKTLPRHILPESGIFRKLCNARMLITLAYAYGIFRILFIFRHIQAYIRNYSYNNINFFFLTYFSTKLKETYVNYNDVKFQCSTEST